MPHSSRVTFFRKETELCTASMTPCPICYETTCSSSVLGGLHTRVRNTRTVAKMLFSGCHKHNGRVKLRTKPSRSNCTVRIKRCGHQFCYDCLETWVEKKNTCPMCRDRLFSNTTNDKNSNDITHEDVEHWLTLSEDRGMGDMDEAGIRGALGDEVDYEGSEEMQGNADENEMRIGRRSDRAEAMLGQGKTE